MSIAIRVPQHLMSVHTQFIGHLQIKHPIMPHLCHVDDKASILPKGEVMVVLGPILLPGEEGLEYPVTKTLKITFSPSTQKETWVGAE
ncbi:hypothetical protein EMCRGX_G028101 [Ephydatia muelleri]